MKDTIAIICVTIVTCIAAIMIATIIMEGNKSTGPVQNNTEISVESDIYIKDIDPDCRQSPGKNQDFLHLRPFSGIMELSGGGVFYDDKEFR